MDPVTIPPEYTAILLGSIGLYGGLSFIIIAVLRRIFPIENNAAHVTAAVIAFALGAWAAVRYSLPLLPELDPAAKPLVFLTHMGGAWWASGEIYRRLRADLWATKANPDPEADL